MVEVNTLQARLDAEFAANEQRLKSLQTEAVQAYEGRQERLTLFEATCQSLRRIWLPRLELLARKFGDQVEVNPHITRELRHVIFDFESNVARVQLHLSASTDTEVRKLVLDYNLDILPILMAFEGHVQAEFPLETIDPAAVGKWMDDRIVDFARTYLAMSQNEHYLKDHTVTDPVAGVKFRKSAAAATLERGGKTLYFIADKTRSEFEKREAQAASKG